LVFLDGRRVKTREDWALRRLEIIRLAEHYIYGSVPAERLKEGTPAPEVIKAEANELDGIAVKQTLEVYIAPDGKDKEADSVIHVNMYVPKERKGPVPAVLLIGLETPKGEGLAPVRYMAEHGFAVCGFSHRGALMGTYRHYFPLHSGPWVKKEGKTVWQHGWGEMAIWAWKARRVFDALVERPEIDGKRIVVAGGSRYASAALLTAAYEERVALLYCWQGVPQNREIGRQGVDFKSKYAAVLDEIQAVGKLKSLPVDNHCLLATVAPRPVLFAAASTNPYGFTSSDLYHYTHAIRTYEFLGATFPERTVLPKERPWKTGIYGKGPMAFLLREGGHAWVLDDWTYLISFAEEQLKPNAATQGNREETP